MDGFYQTFTDIIETIDESIEKERIVPALILLYSGIDGISSLSDKNGRSGRSIFMHWTRKWMLRKYPLPCNELDIYSARCGLLHQQTSQSDLTKNKQARQILYSWKGANIKLLELAIEHLGKEKECIAVSVEDILWSFRNGFADCFDAIYQDEDWKKSFEQNAQRSFISTPAKTII